MELLQVENLTFTYPDGTAPALSDLSFSLKEGSFTVLCGASGCGKSTLLHLLKKEVAPFGKKSGTCRFGGTLSEELDARVSASEIGLIRQDPDSQIVTDVVWHELAFGLENLGTDRETIRTRVAEMATYFGIEEWYHKRTDELSGGQKQLLNLASVMTVNPRLLLLDEPTAQLDPIAAGNFLSMLERVHRELGVTILIAEHRLEDILPLADKVMVLTDGKLTINGDADSLGESFRDENHPIAAAMPAASRIFMKLGGTGRMPLTVTDGRAFLRERFGDNRYPYETPEPALSEAKAAELSEVYFRYERTGKDVLKDASLTIYEGEHFCLLGGNGSGKTTLLHILSGVGKAYAGSVKLFGKKLASYRSSELFRGTVSMLPQDPKDVFVSDTVREDWLLSCKALSIPENERDDAITELAKRLGAASYADRHPYDLSGGEQQKAALVKVLLYKPKLLLLDEPTKGLDARYKEDFKKLLEELKKQGTTILTVTHDPDFAAASADRVGLCFDGGVTAVKSTHAFFKENAFYTTAACRIAGWHFPGAITCEEVGEASRGRDRA